MNKKGSAAVFLVFIMTAMIAAAAAFVYMSKHTACKGIGDGVLNLAMRSVLSEFDLTLKDRYGLLAFEKSGMAAALEIDDKLDYSLGENNPFGNIQIIFSNYTLSGGATLKTSILEYMKFANTENMLMNEAMPVHRQEWENRTLRNKAVIEALPSRPFKGSIVFLEKIEQLKDQMESVENVFNSTSEEYLLNKYILTYFKYATGGPLQETSFFEHEVEYILVGSFSNEENLKKVQQGLKILRTALNAAYLYKDEEKRNLTLAAAEVLTPGSAAATQAILIATWAAAEAKNDVQLLLSGKCVPLMKDDASWATDLEKVLENISEDCIDPGNSGGMYYDDYLMVFLYFQDENLKLARTADLIQINMKLIQSREFQMNTCKSGLRLKAECYGKDREYETCY